MKSALIGAVVGALIIIASIYAGVPGALSAKLLESDCLAKATMLDRRLDGSYLSEAKKERVYRLRGITEPTVIDSHNAAVEIQREFVDNTTNKCILSAMKIK